MDRPSIDEVIVRDFRPGAFLVAAGALLLLPACGSDSSADGADAMEEAAADTRLGPVDGLGLPPVDLDRVQVGDTAPDFSLKSYAGPVVTLSDFRGRKDVVLVFYRGHW